MDLSSVFSQLIRVDGLDIWDGLSRVGCNREVYADSLKIFCGDLEKKSTELAHFLEKENWKGYTATLHAIKGGLAGIGLWELANKTLELEDAAKKDDYDLCRLNSGAVLREIEHLIAELRAGALFGKEPIRREQVPPEYLEQKLGELYRLCISGTSTEADTLAEELRHKTCGGETDALVETICTHVENLDYHLVLQLLSEKPYIKG